MRLPKDLYWVEIVGGQKLRYGKKGGGKFSSLRTAIEARDRLAYRGIEAKIFVTQELEWEEVVGL